MIKSIRLVSTKPIVFTCTSKRICIYGIGYFNISFGYIITRIKNNSIAFCLNTPAFCPCASSNSSAPALPVVKSISKIVLCADKPVIIKHRITNVNIFVFIIYFFIFLLFFANRLIHFHSIIQLYK